MRNFFGGFFRRIFSEDFFERIFLGGGFSGRNSLFALELIGLSRFWFFSRFWFLSRFCLNAEEGR